MHFDLGDLGLLATLDALLQEGSVTGAARRAGLSTPAMSHALARIRRKLGDPLLVRSGRGMVLTPRAEALRPRVHTLVSEAAQAQFCENPLNLLVKRACTVNNEIGVGRRGADAGKGGRPYRFFILPAH